METDRNIYELNILTFILYCSFCESYHNPYMWPTYDLLKIWSAEYISVVQLR